MNYSKSKLYRSPFFMNKIMGPNPLMLCEEVLTDCAIPSGAEVIDLGSGQGLTSVFLAREYGFRVTAADLWSDPAENRAFFREAGLTDAQITPVKADATSLSFPHDTFDGLVCVDSYNYFGRDPAYLDRELLPIMRSGAYLYIAVPGMKKDLHDAIPPELLLSWTPEQLDYLHGTAYWENILSACRGAEVLRVYEMETNKNAWADWLAQENEYAVGDRKSMNAGAGKYLNFVGMILRKK